MRKRILILLGILMAVVCVGCGDKMETVKSEEHTTESETGTMIAEESSSAASSWDLPPMIRINGILYYSSNRIVEDINASSSMYTVSGTIEKEVDASEIPKNNEESNFGSGWLYYLDKEKHELLVEINGKWEVFEGRRLTLERIAALANEGTLGWTTVDGYIHEDIGSGLLISRYDIDDDFYFLVGGTGKGEPMYMRLVSKKDDEDYYELGKERDGNSSEIDLETFICEKGRVPHYVRILAYVKEINDDSLLIRSDADDFPGVFYVINNFDHIGEEEFSKLTGGTFIRILMKDLHRTVDEKIPVYRAEEIVVLQEEDNEGQEDIVLTDVPKLSLTDPLSSQYQPFSISSGNYTWTVEENGQARQTVACGTAPLDEAMSKNAAKLKLPSYAMDQFPYLYSTVIRPDRLTVRQWDVSDIGNNEAKEERITVYYDGITILSLQEGKVYEFTAEWKEENLQKNKFYAAASYVLVTE